MNDPTNAGDYLREVTVGEPEVLDGPIRLVPYDGKWPRRYARLAARIRTALSERALLIEHVGSTAVPGLAAKPVLDVVLAVTDSADEPSYGPQLVNAGFELRIREPAWFEHRLFRPADRSANLHVFSTGCEEVGRMVMFRDRLRGNDGDRDLYAATKRELAGRTWRYTQDYAQAKSEVVREILARAQSSQGETPGTSPEDQARGRQGEAR